MKIGIDARLYSQTGVGRYIRNLIKVLGEIDRENNYVVFLMREDFERLEIPNERWQKRVANLRWHSCSEQLLMPRLLYKEKLDLVHFPYFNAPIFYRKPFVVTIHDLTHLYFDTGRASTLPWLFYQIKRLGLKIVLWYSINKSKKIMAVSKATKDEILKNYKVDSQKIAVTYEGMDDKFKVQSSKFKITCPQMLCPPETQYLLRAGIKRCRRVIQKSKIEKLKPYLLYVGNAYPHKNLERLVGVIAEIREIGETKLVLVGPEDYFYKRLKDFVEKNNLEKRVIFYGAASDEELSLLYQKAICLVLPSLMEGFGLVGLEAMSQSCPVLSSDIPSLREIYQEAAIFFNPQQESDIKEKIKWLINSEKTREVLINKGKERIKSFSWQEMGKRTKKVYETNF